MSRETKETSVEVSINLDGTGICDCDTGIPFLDHMLDVSYKNPTHVIISIETDQILGLRSLLMLRLKCSNWSSLLQPGIATFIWSHFHVMLVFLAYQLHAQDCCITNESFQNFSHFGCKYGRESFGKFND